MDLQCSLIVGGVSVILVALGYGYKIKVDKKCVLLEKKDQEQEKKHEQNQERIKELETDLSVVKTFNKDLQKKNGAEQRQIDELKKELAEVKKKISW